VDVPPPADLVCGEATAMRQIIARRIELTKNRGARIRFILNGLIKAVHAAFDALPRITQIGR
jgi:hypothetical protein